MIPIVLQYEHFLYPLSLFQQTYPIKRIPASENQILITTEQDEQTADEYWIHSSFRVSEATTSKIHIGWYILVLPSPGYDKQFHSPQVCPSQKG